MTRWRIIITVKNRTFESYHTGDFMDWANANRYKNFDKIIAERVTI